TILSTNAFLILRSMRSMRLEGWPHASPFETPPSLARRRAPQGEADVRPSTNEGVFQTSRPQIVQHLVHRARGFRAAGFAHDLGRDARDGGVVRHWVKHHRPCGDARAVADLDVAEDFRA